MLSEVNTMSRLRPLLAVLVAALVTASPCLAFDTPLSEQAIREAYFLGQRRDDSLARFLSKYTKYLEPPRTGPHIASITFFTPFALAAHSSSQHAAGYSAQQAQIDHRGKAESVRIIVQIQFTESYGALIPAPTGSRSGSPTGFIPRPYDFWKDFDVRIFNSRSETADPLRPFSSHGEPNLLCGDDGGCSLTGATLTFDFLADAFESGEAFIDVILPEGEPVDLNFDLSGLR
jgi:hypothetical protein